MILVHYLPSLICCFLNFEKSPELAGLKRNHPKEFFPVKPTQNTLSAPGWNKEETKRKRISQKVIVTAKRSGLVLWTKVAYGDFLKKPKPARLVMINSEQDS